MMEPSKKQSEPIQEPPEEWPGIVSNNLPSEQNKHHHKTQNDPFETKVAKHQSQKGCPENYLQAPRYSVGPSLMLVSGPTASRKIMMLHRIEWFLRKETRSHSAMNPGQFPIVVSVTLSASPGNFDWQDYYARALTALNDLNEDNTSITKQRG